MTEEEYRSYSESGVDVDRGDECSRIAYEACQKTFANQSIDAFEPESLEGGFAGPMKVISNLKGSSIVKNSDGVGSKVLVAQRMGQHESLGYDLIAMLADDTASTGALPVAGTNTLDIGHANPKIVSQLMEGLVDACKTANVAMVGGEIAELPDQVKGYRNPYIWNGDLLGVIAKGNRVNGAEVEPGQSIIGLRSKGIRANGLTLAREICSSAFGNNWHEERFNDEFTWGEVLLKPSRICAPIMVELAGGFNGKPRANLTGMVHVTGGGLANLKRVLPRDTGAVIDDPISPHEEFLQLQELGPVADEEAYRTWNMGQCVMLVTPDPEKVETVLEEFEVAYKVIGKITEGDGVTCHSKGREKREFVI